MLYKKNYFLTHIYRYSYHLYSIEYNNNNNSEVLLGAIIHRPDAPLASQERKRVRKLGR